MFFKKKKDKELQDRFKVVKIKDLDHLEEVINNLKEEMSCMEENEEFSIEIKGNSSHGTACLKGNSENLLKGVSILVKSLLKDTDIQEYDIREAVRIGIDAENIQLERR